MAMPASARRPIRVRYRRPAGALSTILCVLFCLQFSLLLPMHSHPDGKDHRDCPLCIAEGMPVNVPSIFFLAALAACATVTAVCLRLGAACSLVVIQQPRAPPALSE